jgi:hypothetical protein
MPAGNSVEVNFKLKIFVLVLDTTKTDFILNYVKIGKTKIFCYICNRKNNNYEFIKDK